MRDSRFQMEREMTFYISYKTSRDALGRSEMSFTVRIFGSLLVPSPSCKFHHLPSFTVICRHLPSFTVMQHPQDPPWPGSCGSRPRQVRGPIPHHKWLREMHEMGGSKMELPPHTPPYSPPKGGRLRNNSSSRRKRPMRASVILQDRDEGDRPTRI